MSLFAFDLGSQYAWARGSGNIITWGSGTLPESYPARLDAFEKALLDIGIRAGQAEAVGYEHCQGMKGQTAEQHHGYYALLRLRCHRASIPIYRVTQSGLKKWATGKGTASKVDMKNAAMRMLCSGKVVFGQTEMNYDESDAVCALFWLAEQIGIEGDGK